MEKLTMEIEDILNAMHTGLIREMHKRKTSRDVNLTDQTLKRIQKVMEGLEEIELEILQLETKQLWESENSKVSKRDCLVDVVSIQYNSK